MAFVPIDVGMMLSGELEQYMKEGLRWVIDLDLEKFFDRVNHDRLMAKNRGESREQNDSQTHSQISAVGGYD